MKNLNLIFCSLLLSSCALVDHIVYPGGREAAKVSTELRDSSKKIGQDPDSPVQVSTFVTDEDTFSCQNLGHISDYGISASSAKNGLISKSEQLGGNRVYLTGTNSISGTAQGYALKCHPMTGVPLEIVHARCEQKSNPSACDYYWQWAMSMKSYESAANISCTACKYDMNEMCGKCKTSKEWLKGEKIKQRLISECNNGNAKSCHKCAYGHYQEGDKVGSLNYAQLGCVHGSKEACQFQKALMQENQAAEQNKLANQAQTIQYMQYQNQVQGSAMRDLANTVDGMSKGSKPIQFNQSINCEYRFHKDMSPSGGRIIQSCR